MVIMSKVVTRVDSLAAWVGTATMNDRMTNQAAIWYYITVPALFVCRFDVQGMIKAGRRS